MRPLAAAADSSWLGPAGGIWPLMFASDDLLGEVG
jgi:hypothetical protein